jgi:hypothetical protein
MNLQNFMGEYNMIDALRKRYEADIAHAQANIQVYLQNPAGIGEHPDLVAAVDDQIDKMAHAEDKLEILKKYYNGYTSTN